MIGNWLGLPEQILSQGCFWPPWLTVDVNDNQPIGLLLFCSDSIHLCYQGIGIILFFFCLSLQKVISLCQSYLLAGTPAMIQRSSQQSAHAHSHTQIDTMHTPFPSVLAAGP